MAAYAYCDASNGRLISTATEPNPNVPEGVSEIELAGLPQLKEVMWDDASRSFAARPSKASVAVDRLQELVTHPSFADDFRLAWQALSAAQRNLLRNGLIRLLGRHRFRNPSETVEIP